MGGVFSRSRLLAVLEGLTQQLQESPGRVAQQVRLLGGGGGFWELGKARGVAQLGVVGQRIALVAAVEGLDRGLAKVVTAGLAARRLCSFSGCFEMSIDPMKPPVPTACALDPSMAAWGVTGYGDPPAILVQIEHPVHGLLSFMWPHSEAVKVRDAIAKAVEGST